VFKKKLEQNVIKPAKVTQLPPIDPTRHCMKSQTHFQNGLDLQTLKKAKAGLSETSKVSLQ